MIGDALVGAPDRFVEISGERLSHPDFYSACEHLARLLEAHPVSGRVAVFAEPSLTTAVAVVGALLAGRTVVPVPPDSGAQELRHLLDDSEATVWVGPPAPGSTTLPVVEVSTQRTPRLLAFRRSRESPQPAFVLYTSGTTGLPKGVVLSRAAIRSGIAALADAWAWTRDDVLVHGLPLFHVHGLILGVLAPLSLGGSLIHVGRGTPEAYAGGAQHGATMYFAVPTIWSRIADSPEHARALSGARLLVSGSAALPIPVFDRIRDLTGHTIVERYGMSETLITVATRSDGRARAGWVGVPVHGVRTRLVDDVGAPVPHDGETVGHLHVQGATLFDGYLNRPDATAQSWTDDSWFRTGDVAVIDAEGNHRIVGRESVDLIKSGGWRIGAGEIESTLLGHPAVAECAVVGEQDADLGQRIVAYVVARGDEPTDDVLSAALIAHVGAELSGHKRPREIRFVDSLPRNEMGKVQKKRLLGE